jgi:hypothetical protein
LEGRVDLARAFLDLGDPDQRATVVGRQARRRARVVQCLSIFVAAELDVRDLDVGLARSRRDPLREVREQAHRLVELARLAQQAHQREDHLGLRVVAGVAAAVGVRAIAGNGGAQRVDGAGDGVVAQLGLGQEQRGLAAFGVLAHLGA